LFATNIQVVVHWLKSAARTANFRSPGKPANGFFLRSRAVTDETGGLHRTIPEFRLRQFSTIPRGQSSFFPSALATNEDMANPPFAWR